MTNKDLILENGYEDVLVYDNPSFEGALIGITTKNKAVYDYDLMVESLMKDEGMSEEDAHDFISYDTDNAYFGNNTPIIVNLFRE